MGLGNLLLASYKRIANNSELSVNDFLSNTSLRIIAGVCEKLHCSPEIFCNVLKGLFCGLSKNIDVVYSDDGNSTKTHSFKICILPSGAGKTLAVEFGQFIFETMQLVARWRGVLSGGTVLSKMTQMALATDGMGILMTSEGLRDVNSFLDGDNRVQGREARGFLLHMHDVALCERCQRRNAVAFRFRHGLHICAVGTEHGLLEYFKKSRKIGKDGVSSRMQFCLYHERNEFHEAEQFARRQCGERAAEYYCHQPAVVNLNEFKVYIANSIYRVLQ